MPKQEPVGSIVQISNSGRRDAEVPEFVRCVDGLDPQMHKVWAFYEDSVMREVHLTAQVDVSAGVVGEFASHYLTESGRRIPIFGRISINESVEWLGVPDFHSNNGLSWNSNLLDPHSD